MIRLLAKDGKGASNMSLVPFDLAVLSPNVSNRVRNDYGIATTQ
jgi:hypothetical protein